MSCISHLKVERRPRNALRVSFECTEKLDLAEVQQAVRQQLEASNPGCALEHLASAETNATNSQSGRYEYSASFRVRGPVTRALATYIAAVREGIKEAGYTLPDEFASRAAALCRQDVGVKQAVGILTLDQRRYVDEPARPAPPDYDRHLCPVTGTYILIRRGKPCPRRREGCAYIAGEEVRHAETAAD